LAKIFYFFFVGFNLPPNKPFLTPPPPPPPSKSGLKLVSIV
jgi:hypothetical protein